MKQLSTLDKLAFYKKRQRKGDLQRLANRTFYTPSHICNVVAGRRTATELLANEMYQISRRRVVTA